MRNSARDQRALLEVLADQLARNGALPSAERRALCGQWRQISHHRAGQGISPTGDAGFILSGWVCRLRRLAGGKRQIFSFFVPGDFVRPTAGMRAAGAYETICLTPVEFVDVTELLSPTSEGSARCPALAALVEDLESQSESLIFDHLVRLGARDAREGIAHLLLELHARMSAKDMVVHNRFPLPIGQRPLGHALGLSTVHINRTLKQMREEGLIDFGAGWVSLVSPACLASLAAGGRAITA